MSYEPFADGELAAVVTYLEMREPPARRGPALAPRSCSASSNPSLDRLPRPVPAASARRWLWFSRLVIDDDELAAIIQRPEGRALCGARRQRPRVGMLELDFREDGECELAFIGLVPELSGKGHGRWLLAEAVSRAWRDGVGRVHVHTCSLDHPAALSRLPPRRLHPVQARDRALPRPAPARHPSAGLRSSGPAAGHSRERRVAGQLSVDPRQHHRRRHRERGAG